MPRVCRQVSESGIYHVMLRGNARQLLFESEADMNAFLGMLDAVLERYDLDLLAWCLMDNHVHLVLEDPKGSLSIAMKSLEVRYARRFNGFADRVGHVFQDRFLSKPIDTDAYLLESVRYVHNNSRDIGVDPADYRWSSYAEYVGSATRTNTERVLELIGGPERFPEFCDERVAAGYEVAAFRRADEAAVIRAARELLGLDDLQVIKTLPKSERNHHLVRLREELRLSIRALERLTGIGRGTIYYVLRYSSGKPDNQNRPQ